ncbi:TetR family transcriptional regulator [Neobacillus bataviensis]|uniref:TetR family transcriptional regulator n=1 Tax=Neobacillus bataviensis TaxID=220685 RepID=A0A561DEU0_9BACI|nr:TetR/AcrR family transcriptional regulator [Neobacillus bataviensis]TWE01912.1 TetR family transcriptional regulator [Neobacillus bataviensis]
MVGIKGNRRTLYSKKVIIDAFLKLLQEKNLNKITVTDICKEADINRGTFYSYYNDPFDLMRSIEEEMIEKMMRTINISGDESIKNILNDIFNLILENIELCKIIFNEKNGSHVLNTILKSVYVRTIEEQKRRFPNANETQLEYCFTYTTGGTIEVVRKWINDEMKLPAEEVIRILETMYMI